MLVLSINTCSMVYQQSRPGLWRVQVQRCTGLHAPFLSRAE
jgi:hypothetical protein